MRTSQGRAPEARADGASERAAATPRVRLLAAAAFLTRLPLGSAGSFDAEHVGRASLLFPVVGAGLGLVQLLPAWAAAAVSVELPPFTAALAGTVLLVVATGAMHLDALADTSDGFGGGRAKADVLRIMRDPAIGTYGGVAIALALVGRVVLLDALLARDAAAVIAAAALSRWSATLLGWRLPYARPDGQGLGAALTEHMGGLEAGVSTALAVSIALLCTGPLGIVLALVVGATSWAVGRLCVARIGGVTGDTLGAGVELSELIALAAAVVLFSARP